MKKVNKEKFLKELEKKLKVLSQEEKQDILNEYEDIIAEKMRHGKTEAEAVKELGDIQSLSEEILKSYKINPKYQKNGSDLLGECEDFIKKGAQKLSEVTEEVVDSFKNKEQDMNLESVFEIVIKVILILVAISLLRIPFWIVGEIGESLFGNLFLGGHFLFANHNLFGFFIRMITEIAYIGVCILLVVTVIKKASTSPCTTEMKKKQISKHEEKTVNEMKNKTEEKVALNTTHFMSQIVLVLLKIVLAFFFLFPLVVLGIGILVVLCILLFLFMQGIGIYGPIVLVLGVFTFITHLITLLTRILFTNKKISLWPFGISLFMVIVGGIFTLDYLWSFTYDSEANPIGYTLKQEEYTYKIEDTFAINFDEIEIDPTLEDNEVRVEVQYYNEIVRLYKKEYNDKKENNSHDTIEDIQYVRFYTEKLGKYSVNDFLNRTILEDLRKQEIHDYRKLFSPYIKVFVNENTKQKIY